MSYEGPERRSDYVDMKDAIHKLEHTVNGNGTPGLAENYRMLKTMVEQMQGDLKESKQARRQIAIGVVVGVVLAALNLITTLVKGGLHG